MDENRRAAGGEFLRSPLRGDQLGELHRYRRQNEAATLGKRRVADAVRCTRREFHHGACRGSRSQPHRAVIVEGVDRPHRVGRRQGEFP